ncbi:hypothetical protein GWD52_12145 [Enterobacteriaceae bacterium 4M9]|nr:hypothetical protein [Enterobacteriaceae bacterium 4M9]
MELNTSLVLFTRRFIVPTLVVLMCFAWAGWKIWEEYKALTAQAIALKSEQMAFYKARLDEKEKLSQWEAVLEQREQALIAQHQAQEKELADGALALERSSAQMAEDSATQRQQEARAQLETLMTQFAATGASLRRLPDCTDKDGWRDYNRADALYATAKAIADANQLTRDYAEFFTRNAHGSLVPLCGTTSAVGSESVSESNTAQR